MRLDTSVRAAEVEEMQMLLPAPWVTAGAPVFTQLLIGQKTKAAHYEHFPALPRTTSGVWGHCYNSHSAHEATEAQSTYVTVGHWQS